VLAEGVECVSGGGDCLVASHERGHPSRIKEGHRGEIDGDVAICQLHDVTGQVGCRGEVDFTSHRHYHLSTVIDDGCDRETLCHLSLRLASQNTGRMDLSFRVPPGGYAKSLTYRP
jgi:hypothetical protein